MATWWEPVLKSISRDFQKKPKDKVDINDTDGTYNLTGEMSDYNTVDIRIALCNGQMVWACFKVISISKDRLSLGWRSVHLDFVLLKSKDPEFKQAQ